MRFGPLIALAAWLALAAAILLLAPPLRAAEAAPDTLTVATVVFKTPDGRGADSHVYVGTLDAAACQDKLLEIETEWPDFPPLVRYCTTLAPSALQSSITPSALPCMRVTGLERAKRGCV